MNKTLKKIFRIKDHPEAPHLWDPEKILELLLEDIPLDELQDIAIVFRRVDGTPGITHSAMDPITAIGLYEIGKDIVMDILKNG